MSKPEVRGYEHCATNIKMRIVSDYDHPPFIPGADWAVPNPLIRLTDHEAAMSVLESDRRKCWEEFKLQGRTMDRAARDHAEERNELLGLLRDIHNGIHCDTLPGNLYKRLELTLFPGDK